MLGWDEVDAPLLAQIAQDFVEAAQMHATADDMLDALRAEHAVMLRRQRDADRKRRDRAAARSVLVGIVLVQHCPVCGAEFPATCGAAHRPRKVCGRKCRGRNT